MVYHFIHFFASIICKTIPYLTKECKRIGFEIWYLFMASGCDESMTLHLIFDPQWGIISLQWSYYFMHFVYI